jgi:tripartite-type tricarboxylate transporter receptor subunit TctC
MGLTSVAAAVSLIKAGELRPIAVTSKERVPALAAYELNNWFGLFAPSGVARAMVQTVQAAAVKALASPRAAEEAGRAGRHPLARHA